MTWAASISTTCLRRALDTSASIMAFCTSDKHPGWLFAMCFFQGRESVLKGGAMPLEVLAQVVDEWVAGAEKAPTAG